MILIYCRLRYSYLKQLLNPSLTYLSSFSKYYEFFTTINRIIIFLKHFNKSGNDSKHQILFTGKYKIKLICVSTMINLRNHTNFNYFICLFNSMIDWLTGCFRHIDSISAIKQRRFHDISCIFSLFDHCFHLDCSILIKMFMTS